ncbi:MAG TPA: helix-turn-helix transcriptional regulator [Bradyrhizobium sp.]|jgi:transcriptional regulator with XRE-family HTH domain
MRDAHVSMPLRLRHSVIQKQRHSVTAFRLNAAMDEKFIGKTIGERVRHWREKRGMSVHELATKVGSKPSTIYGLEIGDQKKSSALHRIAKILGLNIEYLEMGKGAAELGSAPIEEIPEDPWPFSTIPFSSFDQLPDRDKETIEEIVRAYISRCEVPRAKRTTKRRRAG